MKVFVLNCGSSTLKFQLFEVDPGDRTATLPTLLAGGVVEQIGGAGRLRARRADGADVAIEAHFASHEAATRGVFDWLQTSGINAEGELAAVGHRVVHGGERFTAPTILSDEVVRELETLVELAPLHNRPAVRAIREARLAVGPDVPMVAVFDTAFHRTLPPWAAQYAIPPDIAARYGARRFGFHGIAHRYMAERCVALLGRPLEGLKAITLQLGNGCSATAIRDGCSVDTSMGMTPLEGLMMGTRSGNVDPSLVGHLMRHAKLSIDQVEQCLNTQSGLLGVSGRSQDMRDLLQAEQNGDERARSAIEMFCHRIRQYLGSYLAILGGADAIVFGGGIGENAPSVRARICDNLNWCGIELDASRNADVVGHDGRISDERSKIAVLVVTVQEERLIAQDAAGVLAM